MLLEIINKESSIAHGHFVIYNIVSKQVTNICKSINFQGTMIMDSNKKIF